MSAERAVSFLQPTSTGFAYDTFSRTFVMGKRSKKTESNRLEILRQSYRLMAIGTWDAISVAELENNIEQTRGAIFYFNKNKADLFVNMIDELFFPIFRLSPTQKDIFNSCPARIFFATYTTAFDRVCENLQHEYGFRQPAKNLLNIIIQSEKHYPNFLGILKSYLKEEFDFIQQIVGSNKLFNINMKSLYASSAGNFLIDSFITD